MAPVETYDERLTTRMATESARGGASAPPDALAAAHLLESYLRSRASATFPCRAGGRRGAGLMADDNWTWGDPFADDEQARERERRRAERAARRRERQGALAEKAREEVKQRAEAPPVASQSAAGPPPEAAVRRSTDHDGAPPPGRPAASRAPSGDDDGRNTLLLRRGLGLLAVAAVVALYFVGKEVKDLGDDPQPLAEPKPAKVSELVVPEGLPQPDRRPRRGGGREG